MGMCKLDGTYVEDVLGIRTNGKENITPWNWLDKGNAQEAVDKINALAGQEIKDKAFTLAPMIKDLNYKDFAHRELKVTIQMPKGTKDLVTNNTAESEFITAKGTALEILEAEWYHPKKGGGV